MSLVTLIWLLLVSEEMLSALKNAKKNKENSNEGTSNEQGSINEDSEPLPEKQSSILKKPVGSQTLNINSKQPTEEKPSH